MKFPNTVQLGFLLRLVIVIFAAFFLNACISSPTKIPTFTSIEKVKLSVPANIKQTIDSWPRDKWWLIFNDLQLNQLIDQAVINNPTLATAQIRIARARSAEDFIRASAGPQLNFDATIKHGRQSGNYLFAKPPLGIGGTTISQNQAAVDFSYELDFWGKKGALIRSADSQTDAAVYDFYAAHLALTTAITRTYMQLVSDYELLGILLDTQKQLHAIRTLTENRVKSGLDTRLELKQTETLEAVLRIDIEQFTTKLEVTRLQLSALAGDMPDSAKNISRPHLTDIHMRVPANIPLDLLGRRPELAAQRARIKSAIGEEEAAKAEFYPSINLAGLVGFQSLRLNDLLKIGSLMTSIGPAIRLPIFDAGRIRANHAGKIIEIEKSIVQYNELVVSAALEVAEQLTYFAALSREENATTDALKAATEAHNLAMLRYRSGLTSYLTVLAVETQLLQQRRAAAMFNAKRRNLHVTLVRALGGGFHEKAASLNLQEPR